MQWLSIQVVTWAFIGCLQPSFFNDSCKQKKHRMKFRSMCKVGAKERGATEDIRATKKKPRTSQELAGLHPFQALGCRGFNLFENTVWRREVQGYLIGNCLYGC